MPRSIATTVRIVSFVLLSILYLLLWQMGSLISPLFLQKLKLLQQQHIIQATKTRDEIAKPTIHPTETEANPPIYSELNSE